MQLRTHPKMKWEGFSNLATGAGRLIRSWRCLPYRRGRCAYQCRNG